MPVAIVHAAVWWLHGDDNLLLGMRCSDNKTAGVFRAQPAAAAGGWRVLPKDRPRRQLPEQREASAAANVQHGGVTTASQPTAIKLE